MQLPPNSTIFSPPSIPPIQIFFQFLPIVKETMLFPRDQGSVVFKFRIPSLFSNRISLLISFYVLCVSSIFAIRNIESCSIIKNFDGFQSQKPCNKSYHLLFLPSSNQMNIFTTIFVEIPANSNETFSVQSEFVFNDDKIQYSEILTSNLLVTGGKTNIMSTGLYPFDSILVQATVDGEIMLEDPPRIVTVNCDPSFGAKAMIIRFILSMTSFVAFMSYALSIASYGKSIMSIEVFLSLLGLLIATCSNFPLTSVDYFVGDFGSYCFVLITKGLFSAYNLITLLLCIYHANDGQLLDTAFIISMVFMFGSSLSDLTFDSRVVDRFFDVDVIVWLFFTSVAIMGKISIYIFIFYNFFSMFGYQRYSSRAYTGYFLLSLVSAGSSVFQNVLFFQNGYKNYSFDLFDSYILQTFIALLLADMHWPQFGAPRPPFEEFMKSRKRIIGSNDPSEIVFSILK